MPLLVDVKERPLKCCPDDLSFQSTGAYCINHEVIFAIMLIFFS